MKLTQRLKQLTRTPRGRMVLAGIGAAGIGVLVLARRKTQAEADGAPMTAAQVAADPRSSAMVTGEGALWADYGTTSPYVGGSIGGGGIGSGPDMEAQGLYDWMADISYALEGLQPVATVEATNDPSVTSPTAPLPSTTTPAPATPRFPGAKTWIDSKGNVREVGTGRIIRPAAATTQTKPKYPNAKTYYDAAGNVREVGTGRLITPATQAPARPTPAAPTPKPPSPAPTGGVVPPGTAAPKPAMTLQQAAAAFKGPRTYKHADGSTRRTAAWTAYLRNNGLL